MFQRFFHRSSSNSTTTRATLPVERAEVVPDAATQLEALQKECESWHRLYLGRVEERHVKDALIAELLDFIKSIEPAHAKGAPEMRKRRDALVAKVEAAMKGESEVKS